MLSITSDRKEVVDFTEPFMTSGIAAVLKHSSASAAINATSPLELANHEGLHFGLIPGTLTYYYFRNVNESRTEVRKIWHRITTDDPQTYEWSSQAGIQRVRNSAGDYVFFVESVFAEYHSAQPPCDLVILKSLLNTCEYAFAVKKGSTLKRRLDRAMQSMKENGAIDRLRKKWWDKECKEPSNKERKREEISSRELEITPVATKDTGMSLQSSSVGAAKDLMAAPSSSSASLLPSSTSTINTPSVTTDPAVTSQWVTRSSLNITWAVTVPQPGGSSTAQITKPYHALSEIAGSAACTCACAAVVIFSSLSLVTITSFML